MEGTQFGRYQLIDLLGRGGMGEVWRAHDTEIDRVVAIKMLLPHFAKDPDFDKRFRREARIAARLNDPHVVPIYDVGEIDGRLYVTMRLIDGVDLDELLRAGPLTPERAVHVIEQIASALHTAHRAGLVHRDVKPSNILLADNDFAYLIDFGIARAADDTGLTSEGSTIGTWAYMAPERFQSGGIEPSSDIYALACVFYQCLTGEPPFPGSTLEQVAVGHMVAPPPRASEAKDTVPTGLDRVIETGLAKQTTERYSTAVEMAAAARRAITEPTGQPHSGPTRSAQVSDSSPRWPAPPNPAVTYPTPPPHGSPPPYTPPPQPGQSPAYGPPPQWVPQQWGPPSMPPTAKPSGRRRGVLIGAIVFVVAMIVIAGTVFAVVALNGGDASPSKPSTPAAGGTDFTGTYRVDYGPGTDLDGKPVPNAPATTSNWDVRSECGARGCVATAASASGNSLLSNMTFDRLGGTWVAVGIASAECGGATASEVWVVVTLEGQSDGTLAGDTVRSSTDSLCAAKRSVKFTRTGDADLSKVPDPSVMPPRVVSPADGLRGSYRQTTTFTNGTVVPGKVLAGNTYCVRTGDRCMSLFHAGGGAVTLMYAGDKWTRNEQGTTTCGAGGTAQITITAVYPMPRQLDDPIAVLTGRGTQTVAAGGACTGGGDFEDQLQRTGD